MTGAALFAALCGFVPTSCCPGLQISTGLDSSNTFQIVRCIRDFVHLRQATVLMALLQPAPETYELFDDVLLLSEGGLGVQCCVIVLLLVEGGRDFGYTSLCCGCAAQQSSISPCQGWACVLQPLRWGQVSTLGLITACVGMAPNRLGKSGEEQCSLLRRLPPQ